MNNSIGVIGAGVMGRGIARLCAQNGYPVLLVTKDESSAMKAQFILSKELADMISTGTLPEQVAERIFITNTPQDLQCTKMVIEAVNEDRWIKQRVYRSLEEVMPTDAILATTTSSLSISKLAEGMKHPNRFIGTHFFRPPEDVGIVEVVLGEDTCINTFEKTLYFIKRLGKQAHHLPDTQQPRRSL